jgi:hypothetical protein
MEQATYFHYLTLCWRVVQFTLTLILLLVISMQPANSSEKNRNRIHHLLANNQHSTLIGSIGGHGGAIAFWPFSSGRLEHLVYLGEKNWVSDIALSRDGNLIALKLFGHNDLYEIGIYSIKERKWLWKKRDEWEFIPSDPIQFLPDNKSFIVLGFERMITFDTLTGVVLKNEKSPSEIRKGYHCLSPTGRYAAAWGPREKHSEVGPPFNYLSKKWVFVFDIIQGKVILETGKLLKPYKNCGGTFTPDEKYLVLGSMGEWLAFGLSSTRKSPGSGEPLEKMKYSLICEAHLLTI